MSLRNPYRGRVDTRPQNDPAVRAGIRGIHRDTDGSVIGGYTAEGQPLGTKSGGGAPRFRGLARWKQMNPGSKLATEKRGSEIGYSATEGGPETRAASGGLLAKRKKLFERMKSASGADLAGMRGEAESLGVTGKGWKRAVGKLAAPTTGGVAAGPALPGRPEMAQPSRPRGTTVQKNVKDWRKLGRS